MLLGSVSSAVLHHAERPTMVIHDSSANATDRPQRRAIARA
jgi:hypothetical protein